jgi:hypothetical protein
VYWYAMLPFHHLIFRALAEKVAGANPFAEVKG